MRVRCVRLANLAELGADWTADSQVLGDFDAAATVPDMG
jgi:hypothetical protein